MSAERALSGCLRRGGKPLQGLGLFGGKESGAAFFTRRPGFFAPAAPDLAHLPKVDRPNLARRPSNPCRSAVRILHICRDGAARTLRGCRVDLAGSLPKPCTFPIQKIASEQEIYYLHITVWAAYNARCRRCPCSGGASMKGVVPMNIVLEILYAIAGWPRSGASSTICGRTIGNTDEVGRDPRELKAKAGNNPGLP